MMPFLRKTRKQLADHNQFLKYSRYAIGEIILVVVGILIALQINNWNEDSKTHLLEQNYLESIRKELDLNIRTALFQNTFNDFQIKNGEIMLDCLDNDYPKNQTEFAIAITHVGYQNTPNYIKNVWYELYATGNIAIIKNKRIKNDLIELYMNMDDVVFHEKQEWSKYNFGYRRLVGDILPAKVRIEFSQNLSPVLYSGGPISLDNYEELIQNLMKIDGLSGYLADIIGTRKVSTLYMTKQIKLMREIIILIDEELK